jgi:RNA polymerase sigma-70 factor (ECF subfamily)
MPDFPAGLPERFPTTHWSLVAQAGQEDRREALGRLLEQYLPALRAHLVYGKRLPPDRADDLLQEFTARKILEKDLVAAADRQLGKFRTFLLTALDRFLLNRLRAEGALKRAADKAVPLAEGDGAECCQDPARAFDVAWAQGVVADALRQMRAECEQSGRMDVWGVFQCRVAGPALEGTSPLDYHQMVQQFGFPSPTAAANALVTAKRMYARILRGIVGQYARDPQEVESEIAELRAALGAVDPR